MYSNGRNRTNVRSNPPMAHLITLEQAFLLGAITRAGHYEGKIERREGHRYIVWPPEYRTTVLLLIRHGFVALNVSSATIQTTDKGLKELDRICATLWPETAEAMEKLFMLGDKWDDRIARRPVPPLHINRVLMSKKYDLPVDGL